MMFDRNFRQKLNSGPASGLASFADVRRPQMRAKRMKGAEVAKAVCVAQVAITVVITAAVAVGWGRLQAMAAFYGGSIAWIPASYMAIRMFAGAARKSPQEVVGAMFRGEIGKFALTAVMFAIGVKLFATQFLVLLAAYVTCLLAYWVVMARASFERSDEI